MKIISLFLFLYSPLLCFSQHIDSLKSYVPIIQRGENDSIRHAANKLFTEGLRKILREENTFSINLDSLKNVSVVISEDKMVKLYTWLVPSVKGNKYDYFGFIQIKTKVTDTLFNLIDSTISIKRPESEKLVAEKWLGAIYYKIIDVKKGKKTYYTLLGWKGLDMVSTQKVIEILYLDNAKPRFGYPLIKSGSVFKNRMIFTYNAQISMTLNFDPNYNGIVYDHLGAGKNDTSPVKGPDGTYDGLKFKKGKWVLYRDIDARTNWEPKEELPEPKE